MLCGSRVFDWRAPRHVLALLAARSINTLLRRDNDLTEARCFGEFERRYRAEYNIVYKFLVSFYDMNKDKESYFWTARSTLRTEETANEAFIQLVSGCATGAVEFFKETREQAIPFETLPVTPVRKSVPEDGVAEAWITVDAERPSAPPAAPQGDNDQSRSVALADMAGDAREPKPYFSDGLTVSEDTQYWAEPSAVAVHHPTS